jgi:hypothetical protein
VRFGSTEEAQERIRVSSSRVPPRSVFRVPHEALFRFTAWRPSIPNTYRDRRQLVFSPVICTAQPQSEPRNSLRHANREHDRLPVGRWNTRRAAIRRIVRRSEGFAHRAAEIVSGGAQGLHTGQPAGNAVPTRAGLVHRPPLACVRARATAGKPTFDVLGANHRQGLLVTVQSALVVPVRLRAGAGNDSLNC